MGNRPTGTQLYVPGALDGIAIAHMQNDDNFVATKIFPKLISAKETGKLRRFDISDTLRNTARVRVPGTEPPAPGFGMDFLDYACKVIDVQHKITEEDKANSTGEFALDDAALAMCANWIKTKREIDFMANFFVTGKWATDVIGDASSAGTNQVIQWNAAGSDPISDIEQYAEAAAKLTGRRPNGMLMSPDVWRIARNHSKVVDRLATTSLKATTLDDFAKVCDMKTAYVAKGVYNAAVPGATDSIDFISGGGKCLLFYAPDNMNMYEPAAGATIIWEGYGGNSEGVRVKTGENTEKSYEFMQLFASYDQKILVDSMGLLFHTLIG